MRFGNRGRLDNTPDPIRDGLQDGWRDHRHRLGHVRQSAATSRVDTDLVLWESDDRSLPLNGRDYFA